jgi:hypothetical protein
MEVQMNSEVVPASWLATLSVQIIKASHTHYYHSEYFIN